MYFIWYIIIGIIAGFVAGKLMRGGGFGLFINLLVGIVGGVLINLIYFYMTDPIADYLTRLRNAIQAKHRVVEVPASNLKKEITKILFEKGYILNYKFVEDGPQGTIKVALKYDPVNKVNAIKKLERISSPGLRQYTGYKEMPRVINGLGIAIISTSKGVMTNKEAAELKIGGEVLCYVY
jgi:small subunit ribosomal protein S8